MRSISLVSKTLFCKVLLLFLLSSLCSFSSVPVSKTKEANPPVEKQTRTQKARETRLNKRYNRLHQRFDQAKNSKKRLHLQKKIRQVERQKDQARTPIFGILGLSFGILAFIAFMASSYISFTLFSVFFAAGIIFCIAGLVISILSLVFHKKDPKRYVLKGLGIAGIILSGILIVFLILSALSSGL